MYETQDGGPFEAYAIGYFKAELGTALRTNRREWANAIIHELGEMQRDPGRSASERMASFLSDAGLLSVTELNFTYNSVGAEHFKGARLTKRLQIHNRVILHAVLSGFLAPPVGVPLFTKQQQGPPAGVALN